MHELGIIVHIAKTLDQVAAENELKKLICHVGYR